MLTVTVVGETVTVAVRDHVKVSLRTKDRAEARERHREHHEVGLR